MSGMSISKEKLSLVCKMIISLDWYDNLQVVPFTNLLSSHILYLNNRWALSDVWERGQTNGSQIFKWKIMTFS